MARSSYGRIAIDLMGKVLRSRTAPAAAPADRSTLHEGGQSSRGRSTPIHVPDLGPAVGRPAAGAGSDARRGEIATDVGRLQIAYAPVRDGDADPGEIVWAWVPFEEDASQGKDRPLLVIGHVQDDVAALAMTSRAHDDRHHHPIGSGPWDRDGRPSWIKLDRLIRLDPDGIRREGAVIDRTRFDAVVEAWKAY